MIAVLFGSFGLFGCDYSPALVKNAKTEGDFVYNTLTGDGETFAVLLDFSEEGKQKEVIVAPEYIGGVKVRYVNRDKGMWGAKFGLMQSEALRRIYFPYDVIFVKNDFRNCPNLERILCFVPEIQPRNERMRYPCGEDDIPAYRANVTYRIDGELYWIDDYDYGTKIAYLPPEPTREGLRFCGWYKDPELSEPWDFAADTLPEPTYDSYGQEIFCESVLFGKFS